MTKTVAVERIQYSFVPNHRDTMEALAHARFSNQEYRLVISLLNQTNGYLREEDKLSLSFLSQLTGMSHQHLCHTINRLVDKNVISKNGDFYRVNRPAQWSPETLKALPKRATQLKSRGWSQKGKTLPGEATTGSEKSLPEQATPVAQTSNTSLPEQATPPNTKHIPPKENNKENSIKKTTSGGARKPRATDPVISEIFAEMRAYLGYPDKTDKDPIPSYGKEGAAIKRMLTRRFTREEVTSCWKRKVDACGGEFVSMTWVNEDIGKGETRRRRRLPTDEEIEEGTKRFMEGRS